MHPYDCKIPTRRPERWPTKEMCGSISWMMIRSTQGYAREGTWHMPMMERVALGGEEWDSRTASVKMTPEKPMLE